MNITLNDPTLPTGTALSVAGVSVLFVNGQSVEVNESDVDSEFDWNAIQDGLRADPRFQLGDGAGNAPVGGSEPVQPQVADVASVSEPDVNPQEGGETN